MDELDELDVLLRKIYEDNAFGKLSDERYMAMSAAYEAETQTLKARAAELQNLLSDYTRQAKNAKEFAALVAQCTDITEVTQELLHTLVDKIVVHEKEVIDGKSTMRVDIYYRFIGKFGTMDGEDLQAPKIRRSMKLLAAAGMEQPAVGT